MQPKYSCRVIKGSLKFLVRNITRGVLLADSVELADTSEKRRTGLLKHTELKPGEGLWIVPCESVHSFFMKFTIDVLYLDREKKVRGMRPKMKPWRVSACLPAHSVLELPAGAIERTGTQKGDQLSLEKQSTE
jgi:uncharacterized membrane protein (UPF0127 family)